MNCNVSELRVEDYEFLPISAAETDERGFLDDSVFAPDVSGSVTQYSASSHEPWMPASVFPD